MDITQSKKAEAKFAKEVGEALGDIEDVKEDLDKISQYLTISKKLTSLKIAGRTKSNSDRITIERKWKRE